MSAITAVIILGTVACVIAPIYLIATLSTWRLAWRQSTAELLITATGSVAGKVAGKMAEPRTLNQYSSALPHTQ